MSLANSYLGGQVPYQKKHLAVSCPVCAAMKGSRCRGVEGQRIKGSHRMRVKRAQARRELL